ncbi:hypothetical protein SEA_LUMOS_137 [Mycobacterium phage Lumos]|uniref:Uncharacterized protein n=1 Tax=Mycobacterium phage Lumos TaxID=1701852 RepID=A0A0K2CMP3_9CAUD|nr:hypothetical protein AVU96_gp052 [Mycobacterium phage Snenia]YP_010012585.1 hypothetical protein J4T93_gp051 [Mycobacterium phage Lumos]ASM62858.1 hypothetical protein SEA_CLAUTASTROPHE_130 [Mycobacterium phage Clautastrophe]QDF16708.1 hypothetical protein PBI_MSGREEN_138 [Mycobacterium phage MsGreen]QPL15013.1 hypothetical protein SEA_JUBIE_138 [Mycobacterium phage Jubie]ALA06643.1 hypothetical protein SEA_LUMOS_137 [Mycobacterium phage Lumos]ALF01583.1 hypothetical protein SNENIA_137 [My
MLTQAQARVHVVGATECYATVSEAEDRAKFLRSVGYVVWVDIRTAYGWAETDEIEGLQMFTDSAEQVAQDIADMHAEYMDDYAEHRADTDYSADEIAEMHDWALSAR